MYTTTEVKIIRQICKRTPSVPWRHLLLPCLLPVPVNLVEKRSPNQSSRKSAQDDAKDLLCHTINSLCIGGTVPRGPKRSTVRLGGNQLASSCLPTLDDMASRPAAYIDQACRKSRRPEMHAPCPSILITLTDNTRNDQSRYSSLGLVVWARAICTP